MQGYFLNDGHRRNQVKETPVEHLFKIIPISECGIGATIPKTPGQIRSGQSEPQVPQSCLLQKCFCFPFPGSRITVLYRKKLPKGPHTPVSLGHKPIPGVKRLRSIQRKSAPKRHLTVSRAYGGCLTHDLVRERSDTAIRIIFLPPRMQDHSSLPH